MWKWGKKGDLRTVHGRYTGTNILKALCGLFESIASILRDIKHKTLHLSGAVP